MASDLTCEVVKPSQVPPSDPIPPDVRPNGSVVHALSSMPVVGIDAGLDRVVPDVCEPLCHGHDLHLHVGGWGLRGEAPNWFLKH